MGHVWLAMPYSLGYASSTETLFFIFDRLLHSSLGFDLFSAGFQYTEFLTFKGREQVTLHRYEYMDRFGD